MMCKLYQMVQLNFVYKLSVVYDYMERTFERSKTIIVFKRYYCVVEDLNITCITMHVALMKHVFKICRKS